jgi:ribosomal protein S18 acetylase RimI-like enzyme
VSAALLQRVEHYLDAAPRSGATAQAAGPFTLFRSRVPWPYYARPRLGLDRPVTVADLERLRGLCARTAVPFALEWVDEVTPSLAGAARALDAAVTWHPLLVCDGAPTATAPPDGVAVRVLAPGDEEGRRDARAVAEVGFGRPGTGRGADGAAERDAARARLRPDLLAELRRRTRSGTTVTAVAVDVRDGVVAAGQHQPVGEATEVVGVATLPAHRRRGLAAAVTSALAADARARGAGLLLLSAGDDEVARVYARVGFRRIGTTCSSP